MNIFGIDLQNPTNVLIAAVILLVAWHFYKEFSDEKPTIILFHLPTCGFCKDMMPEWNKFQKAHESDSEVNVQKINCNEYPDAAKKNGVSGFPTIIKFKDGKKKIFDGERTAEALEGFLQN